MSILEVTLSHMYFILILLILDGHLTHHKSYIHFNHSSASWSMIIWIMANHDQHLWIQRYLCQPFCLWPSWHFAQKAAIVSIQSVCHHQNYHHHHHKHHRGKFWHWHKLWPTNHIKFVAHNLLPSSMIDSKKSWDRDKYFSIEVVFTLIW